MINAFTTFMAFATLASATELIVGTDAADVQATLDLAKPGDVVVLPEGRWPGPARVDKTLTLTSRGGVLVGTVGQTLIVEAPGAIIASLVVEGSGDELRGPDACAFVAGTATGAVIRDSRFTDCLFGIWVNEVEEVRLLNNVVIGRPEERPPSKGNGIHLFDSKRLEVRGNRVEGARDGIYVSATHDSIIAENRVSNQRYGIHYMYSYSNQIIGNVANHNSGGIALMQSRDLKVVDNVASDNERQGILFRDALDSEIRGNTVERNGEGMFFFSSVRNEISGNVVGGNQICARIWAGTVDNNIHNNAFVANRVQIFYVASEDQTWGSNYWSDNQGWDQDDDGLGDRPYRNAAFTARLLHRYPQAVLLLSSPTLELLSHLQARLPALRVPSIIDPAPLINRTGIE